MLKKSLRVLTLTVATAGMVAVGVGAATATVWSPVANPSFRSPDVMPASHTRYHADQIPGWNITRGNVDVVGRDAARTGSMSNALDLNGSERGTIEQSIPVTANRTVTVTFRAGRNVHRDCQQSDGQSFAVGITGRDSSFRTFQVGMHAAPAPRNVKPAANKPAGPNADDGKANYKVGQNAATKAGHEKAAGPKARTPKINDPKNNDPKNNNAADNTKPAGARVQDPKTNNNKANNKAGHTLAEDPLWQTYIYQFTIPGDMASLAFRSESEGGCGALITDVRVSEND